MSQKMDTLRAGLIARGIPAYGSMYGLAESLTSAIGQSALYLFDPDKYFTTLALASATGAMVSDNDSTLLITPEAHTVKTAITFANDNCNIVGMCPAGRMNMRSRFSQTVAAISPMMTISGYQNMLDSLHFMQGYSGASDLVGLSITGQRNTFQNVHILPQNATAAAVSTFRLVSIDASEQYFKNCTIGGDGIVMAAGALLQLGATSDGGPPRSVFENCTFIMRASAAAPFFIDASLGGLGEGVAEFYNCRFINIGTSLTYAINGAGLNNFQLYFDPLCSFAGATDVVAAAYVNYVWLGGVNIPAGQIHVSNSALYSGLASHPQVS